MHSFDPEIAKQIGIAPAVIYQNIVWWIAKNKANEQNQYDGHYWTYNSVKAFATLFPYLTEKQIRTSLDKLVEEGFIVSGNHNQSAYDRTKWFRLGGHLDLPCGANGFVRGGEPIPDIKPDIKPDITLNDFFTLDKTNDEASQNIKILTPIQDAIDAYTESANRFGFPVPKGKLTTTRISAIKARIKDHGLAGWKEMLAHIEKSQFLQSGGNRGKSPITIDWVSNPSNFSKIIEGNYDDRRNHNQSNQAHSQSSNGSSRSGGGLFEAAMEAVQFYDEQERMAEAGRDEPSGFALLSYSGRPI